MPDPSVRQNANPDLFLTNVAVSWSQANDAFFVANKVFPVVGVDQPSARYRVWSRAYFLRDEVGPRPIGGPPRQIGYRMSSDTYAIEEEALEFMLEDRERDAYVGPPSGAPAAKGVELLQSQHMIHRDVRWAASYMTEGVWGTDLTGVAASPSAGEFLQLDNDDSDPIDFFGEIIDGVGDQVGGLYRPNKAIFGKKLYRKLRAHPALLGRLGQNSTRSINKQVLADLLEVDEVLVPEAIVNVGPERETVAATEAAADYRRIIDPEDGLLVYAAPSPSTEVPSAGYTFAWRKLLGAQADNPLAAVTRGREPRAYSEWFHVRTAYEFKVVAPELGVFIKDAVA